MFPSLFLIHMKLIYLALYDKKCVKEEKLVIFLACVFQICNLWCYNTTYFMFCSKPMVHSSWLHLLLRCCHSSGAHGLMIQTIELMILCVDGVCVNEEVEDSRPLVFGFFSLM